jgi:hypothetical protein
LRIIAIIVLAPAAGGSLWLGVLALVFLFGISDFSKEPGQINTYAQAAPCVPNAAAYLRLLENSKNVDNTFQNGTEQASRVGGHWIAKDTAVRVLGRGEYFNSHYPSFTVVSLSALPGTPACSARSQDLQIGFWQWLRWKWFRSAAQEKLDGELGEKYAEASAEAHDRWLNPSRYRSSKSVAGVQRAKRTSVAERTSRQQVAAGSGDASAAAPVDVVLTVTNRHCKAQDYYVNGQKLGTIAPDGGSSVFELQSGRVEIYACEEGTTKCSRTKSVRLRSGLVSRKLGSSRSCAEVEET